MSKVSQKMQLVLHKSLHPSREWPELPVTEYFCKTIRAVLTGYRHTSKAEPKSPEEEITLNTGVIITKQQKYTRWSSKNETTDKQPGVTYN